MYTIKEIIITNLLSLLNDSNHTLGIAVSGGADSMCLISIIDELSSHFKKITALIVDHRLRDNSTSEAQWVQEYLTTKGITSHILTWEGPKPQTDIQNLARQERYRLLYDACKHYKLDTLLTAHTQNDQAETVLMRLMHGSGSKGLGGIPAISTKNNIKLIRPMLNINRSQIIAHLQTQQWQWVEDPSNQNMQYERIQLRNILQSLPSQRTVNICQSANKIARCDDFITQYTLEQYQQIVRTDQYGILYINKERLYHLHEEIIYRILAFALKQLNPQHNILQEKQLMLLQQKLLSNHVRKKFTFYGCEIFAQAEEIKIFRELANMPPPLQIEPRQTAIWNNQIFTNNTFFPLIIRPLNQDGLKQLKTLLGHLPAKPLYATPALFKEDGTLYQHFLLKEQI